MADQLFPDEEQKPNPDRLTSPYGDPTLQQWQRKAVRKPSADATITLDDAPGRVRRNDYATSRAGAEAIKLRAGSQKALLLIAFADGELTDEEAAINAGLSLRSCFWKRCGELRDANLIEFTGAQRVGSAGSACGVSAITAAGRHINEGSNV